MTLPSALFMFAAGWGACVAWMWPDTGIAARIVRRIDRARLLRTTSQ